MFGAVSNGLKNRDAIPIDDGFGEFRAEPKADHTKSVVFTPDMKLIGKASEGSVQA